MIRIVRAALAFQFAMALAVAGLKAGDCLIEEAGCISKSYLPKILLAQGETATLV